MKLAERIGMQMRKPAGGLFGRMITRGMVRNTAEASEWTISLIDPGPEDKILEIGFGTGLALNLLARTVESGFLVGIDWSEEMVKQATRLNRAYIESGKLSLTLGDINDIQPFPDEYFDAILSVHGIYFWQDPLHCMQEFFRMMKPGGRVGITFWSEEKSSRSTIMRTPLFNLLTADEIDSLMKTAGFKSARFIRKKLKYAPAICVLGYK